MDTYLTAVEGVMMSPDSDTSMTPTPALTDDKLYSAGQKERILNEWRHFVTHGFQQPAFTPELYKLLHLHCDLPDCGDRPGFWHDFFNNEADTLLRFVKQFSVSGKNALSDNHNWLYTAPKDLKQEMCAVMTPLAPVLVPLLTGLATQHQMMLQQWQSLADLAGLPHQPGAAGYRVSDNTRQLLSLAARSIPRPPIHGLQIMFPNYPEQPDHAKTK